MSIGSESELRAGDRVVYRDRDRFEWGPWKVVGVCGGVATLMVEKMMRYTMDADLLQKV